MGQFCCHSDSNIEHYKHGAVLSETMIFENIYNIHSFSYDILNTQLTALFI